MKKEVPEALDRMIDLVLAYRPKSKKRRKQRHGKKAKNDKISVARVSENSKQIGD